MIVVVVKELDDKARKREKTRQAFGAHPAEREITILAAEN